MCIFNTSKKQVCMVLLLILLIIFLGFFFGFMTDMAVNRKGDKNEESKRHVADRFAYYNPNPTESVDKKPGDPKTWNKGDCVVRAFCGVLDLSWDEVYSDLCRLGQEYHEYPNSNVIIDKYAREKGMVKKRLESKMTISEFAETHDGVYFIKLRTHAVCVKDNKVHDSWNSGYRMMSSYYEKQAAQITHKPSPSKKRKPQEKAGDKEGIKNDYVVSAFCGVLDLPFDIAYAELCRVGAEIHDMPDSSKTVVRYAKEKGLVKKSLPTYMRLSEFAESQDGTYLVPLNYTMNCLVACVKGNKIYGHPSFESYKIRSYFEKVI